jgi:hypothetical protein
MIFSMAVLKLRNKPASKHLMTQDIWSIDPGKTPMWGKPVREREFLVLQFLEITYQQK